MSSPGESESHLKQRRSSRFPFDSLVRLTVNSPVKQPSLWGRSTDLCREGVGVMVIIGRLVPEELVGVEIPLPAAMPVYVEASVRYCKEGRCGLEFVDVAEPQRKAIQAACEWLKKASGHG